MCQIFVAIPTVDLKIWQVQTYNPIIFAIWWTGSNVVPPMAPFTNMV